jgi:hypothetical protein
LSDERIDITEAELIAAALDAQSGGTIDLRHGATTAEVARAKGCSIGKAKKLIATEKAAGRLRLVKVQRETLDEKITTVTGWQLVTTS